MSILSWFTSRFAATEATAQTAVAAAPVKAVSLIHAGLAAIELREKGHPALLAFTEYLDSLVEKYGAGIVQEVDQAVLRAVAAEFPIAAPVLAQLIDHPSPVSPAPAIAPPVSAVPPAAK